MASLEILTLNIASPSRRRAERQLAWLGERSEDVLVLTETSDGEGSRLLDERLRGAGWEVRSAVPPKGERGVLVASRAATTAEPELRVSYLPFRVATISIGAVEVIGTYAPSRDESAEKIARKRRFLAELLTLIGSRPSASTVLIGDLNLVERGRGLGSRLFADWEYELYEELPSLGWHDAYRYLHPDRAEYSWADPDGIGFRFDHCFVGSSLAEELQQCEYVHDPRETGLSDHSGLTLRLRSADLRPLDVNATLDGAPPTLF